MSTLTWDSRPYDAGVDRGVIFPPNNPGVAWNGLTAVNEGPTDTGVNELYFNGQKYRQTGRPGSFAATIEAFTYPVEFEEFDGYSGNFSRQRRKPFGFSYRVMAGERDYKIHLVYNALATPSSKDHKSISDASDPVSYSWEISTTPIPMPGAKPSAHLVIDSARANPEALEEFERILYGGEVDNPRLPLPQEIFDIFEPYAIFVVTDNGDGTVTYSGPDDAVFLLEPTVFQLSWPSVIYIDEETYRASSL